nr:response regulator [Azospirillum sp. SYSU D00513]
MIVEDEALIAMHLEALVLGMGHEVCGLADRTEQAIRLARDHAPDLVLVDVHLACGDSGLAAAQVIAAEGRIAIIIVSANINDIAPADLSFRPSGLVGKPYSESALRSAIAALRG